MFMVNMRKRRHAHRLCGVYYASGALYVSLCGRHGKWFHACIMHDTAVAKGLSAEKHMAGATKKLQLYCYSMLQL